MTLARRIRQLRNRINAMGGGLQWLVTDLDVALGGKSEVEADARDYFAKWMVANGYAITEQEAAAMWEQRGEHARDCWRRFVKLVG